VCTPHPSSALGSGDLFSFFFPFPFPSPFCLCETHIPARNHAPRAVFFDCLFLFIPPPRLFAKQSVSHLENAEGRFFPRRRQDPTLLSFLVLCSRSRTAA